MRVFSYASLSRLRCCDIDLDLGPMILLYKFDVNYIYIALYNSFCSGLSKKVKTNF